MNEYLSFYEKYKISPVVQDIDNFKEHVRRRNNLYRQLGASHLIFKDKDILEIGPGGGYNALVTYSYGPKTYTLIEPSTQGYHELKNNFKNLDKNVFIFNEMLEEFKAIKQYDIIICEGLIPGLSSKEQFIKIIQSLLKPNGIFIMTTSDQVSVFFEIIRKYMANVLIKDIEDIDEKVKILVDSFSSHLDTLKGMTRSYSDWCLDNLVGDAILEHTLSINDAIELLKNNYILGISPNIFNNYSWYKQLPTNTFEYNQVFQEQMLEKWHNFIDYRFIQKDRDYKSNIELSKYCLELIKAIKNSDDKIKIVDILEKIKINLKSDIEKETLLAIEEAIEVINDSITPTKIKNMKFFNSAFGRGQAYISFVKENIDYE
ncbi:class I SAM-dependent methyltransferase [Sulfurimonas sp.]|uniref:class I SAM-dependent methyltransferase n=1 Tax=Sulfurimonas sp. TaxID=2022749 RepID=UPI003565A113